MKKHYTYSFLSLVVVLALTISCKRDLEDLELASYPDLPEVFLDAFSPDLNYAAFGGSDVRAFDVDTEVKYKGTTSMRIAVPDVNDPAGAYAGGVYFSSTGRDLSGYTVLSFWAKASKSASIDLVGFGNDLGENKFQAAIAGLAVNTNWKKYYIPIPDAAKLKGERGMFFYSEGPEDGKGYTFWIDEVQFENLGTVGTVQPRIMNGEEQRQTAETGATFTVTSAASFNLPNGIDQVVTTSSAYFEFSSSNPAVASVNAAGIVEVKAAGTAVISASLGGQKARGSLTIVSTGAPVLPTVAAPTPNVPANRVISVFSNAYNNAPVDFFNGYWQFSTAQTFDIKVANDDIKRYTNLNFVGIQFTTPTINARAMTHFHMDIWTPEDITPNKVFKVLLVDFGPDGSFGGTDNTSHELTLNSSTLKSKSWVSLDIPFSSFPGLTSRANLAQIVLSGDLPNLFVDNIYFYDNGSSAATEPTNAAPTPTLAASRVISLFSNAYTNVPVDTWRTSWSAATLSDVQVAGNAVKKYSELDFVGIETVAQQLNASGMTHFHIDVWSADFSFFGIKLVDFGANGAFGGGDDVEHQVNYNTPAKGRWISYDIPLSEFTGLRTRNNIAQLILVGQPTLANTVYVDNVYFHN